MTVKTASGFGLVMLLGVFLASGGSPSWGSDKVLLVENQLANMVRETYGSGQDVYVKVERVPSQLNNGATVKDVDLVKVPGPAGRGLALVHYEGQDSRARSSYVAFRTFDKKRLFYLKRSMRKGEHIEQADIRTKDAYIGEKSYLYPEDFADLRGKVLKKDMIVGSLLTLSVLEEPQAVRRGQGVTIVCENGRLMVQTPGKAFENGRRGDRIRVRSLSSDRDVFARVVDHNTVAVDF